MNKLIDWLNDKILPLLVVFLLIFIPLYPKLPLVGIAHTWVYIRLEDVFILITAGIWVLAFIKNRPKLPALIGKVVISYWLLGFVSTLFALIFIFPHLANVFPNVAIFHFLRRIEYLVLFFIAASTIKKSSDINKYYLTIAVALLGVILYGFGQKFLGLPAYLTMNEEFAKGVPLYLPPGARITSTFGGHYDLAAFLVLTIAMMGSYVFGLKKVWQKVLLILLCIGGVSVLLFTASRVSFAVYLFTVTLMLVLQKKKRFIIPVILLSLLLLVQVRGTAERFAKTFRIQPIVINSRTGTPIAILEKLPPEISGIKPTPPSVQDTLPLGTGFIGLPPATNQPEPEATTVATIRKAIPVSSSLKLATVSSEISTISGSFLIQKAFVYDISFTTRFQGEWPRAWAAFLRNPLTGSGYSSINLATDNDYLRLLGETGILGFLSFLLIFATYFILVAKKLDRIESPVGKSFVIGVSAGLFGLALNAVLIDVFEASKVAFVLWPMMGLAVGVMELGKVPQNINLWTEFKKIFLSNVTFFLYLMIFTFLIYQNIINNYFSGDDFVWLKWAASAKLTDLVKYFYISDGFFYRPLPKILYFLVYTVFWLKPTGYHIVSIFLYFLVSFLAYLLANKILKNKFLAFLSTLVFLFLPINSESAMWVSSYSGMLMTIFTLTAFYLYLGYEQSKKRPYLALVFVFFVLALMSHEAGVALPFLILWVELFRANFKVSKVINKKILVGLLAVLPLYGLVRYLSHSVGINGDYSYNLVNLPFNIAGNFSGYIATTVFGMGVIPFYNLVRMQLRSSRALSFNIFGLLLILIYLFRKYFQKIDREIYYLIGLIFISLLPYLGLGNLSERYALMSSIFIVILFVLLLERLIKHFWGNKKYISVISMVLATFIVTSYYQKDLSQAANNWYVGGETAKKIVYAVKDNYRSFPKNSTLYFVNLPIRNERAWVFPVGLPEAIWFVYRDETLKVEKANSSEEAFKLSEGKENSHVFAFENGGLKEVVLK